jgi:hypothetical protein
MEREPARSRLPGMVGARPPPQFRPDRPILCESSKNGSVAGRQIASLSTPLGPQELAYPRP